LSAQLHQISEAIAWHWSGNGCSAVVKKDDVLWFYEVKRGEQFFRGARRSLHDAKAEALFWVEQLGASC
jgi:hypothetical protein